MSSTSSRRVRFLFVRLALAAVLLPQLALAQPQDDPRKDARLHLGVFYITPTFAITDLGMDTNVFNQATGEKQSDFTVTVRPGARVWVPFAQRAAVRTTGAVDLVYFQKFDSQRSVNPGVAVRPEVYFNRLTLFAEGSSLRTRERPSFEIDARAGRTEKQALVGLDVRLLRKVSVELSARERHIRFRGDAVFLGTYLDQVLNRNERALAARARYRWSPLTTFVLLAEAQSDRFTVARERNTDSVRIMPGLETTTRALVSGSAYVGVRRFVGLSDELPDFQGLVARAGLGYTLLGTTRLSVTADRDIAYSFERLQPYYVQNGVGLTVRHALGRRFDVTAGGQRYTYAYRDLVGGSLVTPGTPADSGLARAERVDVTRNVHFSVGIRPNRDMRVGVGASYWERTSNVVRYRNYNGVRAGVSVEYGF